VLAVNVLQIHSYEIILIQNAKLDQEFMRGEKN